MALDNPTAPTLDGSEDVARGATFLRLSWNAVTDAVTYTVHCGSQKQTFTQPTVPLNTQFADLPSNTRHAIKLEVVDTLGNSKVSPAAEIFTRPERPSFLKLANPVSNSRRSNNVILVWEDVAGVNIYEVESDTGVVKKTGDPGITGFEFKGLASNVEFAFQVRSRVEEASGRVDISFDSASFVVRTRPPTPGPLSLRPLLFDSIQVAWDLVPTFNHSGSAIVQLGRTFGTNPADDIRASIPSIAANSHIDSFSDYSRTHKYGLRVAVAGNESFWSEVDFHAANTSAITHGYDVRLKVRQNVEFLLDLVRDANQ